MTDMGEQLVLGAEFPAATRDQWLKLVDGVLKGAPFDKKLVSRTYDGLSIEPLYAPVRNAHAVVSGSAGAPWQVAQRVDHPDAAAANAEALHDLENGATALSLVFAGSIGSYGYGLAPSDIAIERVLDGIHLDAGVAIELDAGAAAQEVSGHLAALVKRKGVSADALKVRFGLDPIGAVAASGQAPLDWADLAANLVPAVRALAAQGFAGPFMAADGRVVHNAGGSEAQELAFVLAVGTAYLRALEAGGIALDTARRMLSFRLAADVDEFMTIAKFRAVRKLWARVETACGLEPAPLLLSAETAWRMMTRRDPWVNALRATVAAFSAGIGGADSVTVLPLTMALGLPDRFARRIARNTQLLLLQEANLFKVADPAAGSGAIEDMTAKLCAAGWSLFQEIEKAGGAWPALRQGMIQRQVAAVRTAREAAVAKRKEPLTGTSEFPHIHESSVSVLDIRPVAPPSPGPAKVTIEPMPAFRLAEPFEKLRDVSDRVLAERGSRPKIFLANLGPIAAFTARAMFAKNFFEAGGIEAVTNDGFAGPNGGNGRTDLAALAAAFKASGAKIACLCSSDELYGQEAVAAAQTLAAAGAIHIYLAGRPGELESALKAVGVQSFIYMGCDALKTLQAAHGSIMRM